MDKRGAKSDEAYIREILGDMAGAKNILVINDEAHHAWRTLPGSKPKGVEAKDFTQATKWVGGLDRIHRARGILTCYDFSATPFTPSGNRVSEEGLFGWIVSDFGLNDAIESGLVKTPRVVIRDDALPDAHTYKSRLYHIYNDDEVKDDLNRRAKPEEPLPDLIIHGYYLLGYDWGATADEWVKRNHDMPPVMITVANRTETAARIKFAFDRGKIDIPRLCDLQRTLHIDSKELNDAESAMAPVLSGDAQPRVGHGTGAGWTKKQKAELLRRQVDTIGQKGKEGERIQNVISVGMLSEGWDAKTVTHIMGLRAFSSQLLCEQVVGRGLRRISYEVNPKTGMFEPEYVNIFGVPFTFLPHVKGDNDPPPPQAPKIAIEPVNSRAEFEISWPNILRIDYSYRPHLEIDWSAVEPLRLDATRTPKNAELAPTIDSNFDLRNIKRIDARAYSRKWRRQRIIFLAVRDVFDQMQERWEGGKFDLLGDYIFK